MSNASLTLRAFPESSRTAYWVDLDGTTIGTIERCSFGWRCRSWRSDSEVYGDPGDAERDRLLALLVEDHGFEYAGRVPAHQLDEPEIYS